MTFPIYAIAVNFLPQQKWESEKQQKKRIDELKGKISEISSVLGRQGVDPKQIALLREQLDNYENELRGTNLKFKYLTAKGAVLIPVLTLLVALAFSVAGLYSFYRDWREFALGLGAISGAASAIAIYRLYTTITAVEYGALSPERTVEFEAGFGSTKRGTPYTDSLEITAGEKSPYRLGAKSEYDVENFEMRIFIPKEVQLTTTKSRLENIVVSTFEEGAVISISKECVFKGFGSGIRGAFISNEKGKHTLSVRIRAKGIYAFEKELFIVVK